MPTIAHLSTVHSPTDTRIFQKELRTLVENGYDTQYVVHAEEDRIENGVQIRSLGEAPSRTDRWRHLIRTYRLARDTDANLYHFHDPELLPVGFALSRRTDGKVVYDAHEDYGHIVSSREWIPEPLRPILGVAVPIAEAAFAHRLDGVVAATEWVAESLEAKGVADVTTLHNFPRITGITPPERSTSTDSMTLAYVGGLSDVRGLPDMLALAKDAATWERDVSLKLIGPFESEQARHKARSYVERNGLEDVIRFVGRVEYEEVFNHLADADLGLALLNTDHYEGGIPTKMFEYMYSELPVVITDIQATDRYFSPEWGQIVPEEDTEAQANVVRELLNDLEKREAMGSAGRDAVEECFCWEREAGKLLDLYEELL